MSDLRRLSPLAATVLLAAAFTFLCLGVTAAANGRLVADDAPGVVPGDEAQLVVSFLSAKYAQEQRRSRKLQREKRRLQAQVRQLRREVLREWDYPTLIAIAAAAYGVDRATLERKARCESVKFTDFFNERSNASNVFQFLPWTWETTPFARFSIFNPFAAVLAGSWMHDVGRGGEWECK